jgi:hypothetical protein
METREDFTAKAINIRVKHFVCWVGISQIGGSQHAKVFNVIEIFIFMLYITDNW